MFVTVCVSFYLPGDRIARVISGPGRDTLARRAYRAKHQVRVRLERLKGVGIVRGISGEARVG